MEENKDQVIDLFITYQMIEMLLFMKLHLPAIAEANDRGIALEKINKEINSKTFGKLRTKYLEKFPNDDYNLSGDIAGVAEQRNSSMHSLWMVIAMGEDKEKINEIGKALLDNFDKYADKLLQKIPN